MDIFNVLFVAPFLDMADSPVFFAEVVISVIVGSELLKQAEADPKRFDLAASWINRRMVDLESRTQRIKEGTHDRLERADKIIDLVRGT